MWITNYHWYNANHAHLFIYIYCEFLIYSLLCCVYRCFSYINYQIVDGQSNVFDSRTTRRHGGRRKLKNSRKKIFKHLENPYFLVSSNFVNKQAEKHLVTKQEKHIKSLPMHDLVQCPMQDFRTETYYSARHAYIPCMTVYAMKVSRKCLFISTV